MASRNAKAVNLLKWLKIVYFELFPKYLNYSLIYSTDLLQIVLFRDLR